MSKTIIFKEGYPKTTRKNLFEDDGKTPLSIRNSEEYNQEVDFGFIEKFAVIGDSYASGEIYVKDTTNPRGYVAGDYYNKSWGQILARKYGAECINMSVGGLTTKTWLTSQKGLPLLNSSDAQELYLCAL